MTSDEYSCALCKQVYTKVRSDEEAMKESINLMGQFPEDSYEVVCDDCYKEFYKWHQEQPGQEQLK